MRPLGNRLRVRSIPPTLTSGGIHLPPSMADDFNTGGPKLYTVLAVGPGRRTKRGLVVPLPIQPGDRVLCHSYTEGPVDLADDTKIITGEQVLAVFPK